MAFYHNGSALIEPTAQSAQSNTDLLSTVDNLKVHLFPEARNQILIRLENMSDLFDGTPESTQYFQVEAYAEELYSRVINGALPVSVTIYERTLSNNQAMADMLVEDPLEDDRTCLLGYLPRRHFRWVRSPAPENQTFQGDIQR
jgi:hypothetical protein